MSATAFYDRRAWRRKRAEVMRNCNSECQICKDKPGRPHVAAEIVHHVYHLDKYPEWGLCEFVNDPQTGKPRRNLLPVCKDCHETVCHPERLKQCEYHQPLTRERW